MKRHPGSPMCRISLAALLALTASTASAQGPCTCFDIADLVNRRAEAEAALSQYGTEIANWASTGAPAAEDAMKRALNARLEAAMTAVTNPRANRAIGETDNSCRTMRNTAPTACLKEVIEQHEWVHMNACRQHQSDGLVGLERWRTLADYAREDMAAYSSELAYVRAALSELERSCRFTLEFRSTIDGKIELATSRADAKVSLALQVPSNEPPKGLNGKDKLKYETKDTGPPKRVVGPSDLARRIPPCYVTYEGKGTVDLSVFDGFLMRDQTPPHDPRIELTLSATNTSETLRYKGPKPCPKWSKPATFWTHRFFLGKRTALVAPNVTRIDGWTIAPRAGVFAEKVITGTCLSVEPGSAPSVPLAPASSSMALGPTTPGSGESLSLFSPSTALGIVAGGTCVETTTLTLKLR